MSDLLNGLRHLADDHPCCADTIGETIKRIEELERELMEQARLNGMGSEREASMLAQIEVLQRENALLREDNARLDWLEDNCACRGGGSGATYLFGTPADVEHGLLRDAIDAARKEAKP